MDKETILKAVEHCVSENTKCENCPLTDEDCIRLFAKFIDDNIKKENEPAPAGTDTSSKENNCQLNDSTKLQICQEQLARMKTELKCITYSSDIECIKERILQASGGVEMILNIIGAGDDK